MLTDNRVLVECHKPLPAIMCVQRRASKKIVTEEDAVAANIASFGDEIGKTTNWITSMFEVQSHFEKDSEEYKTLDYRIMSGQLFQQNAIDKAKGIVAKPMPRYWHDRHSVNLIEDPEDRRFQLSIVADKKPYFMRIVYPALAKQYNTYIKTTNKNALREFGMSIEELESIPESDRTDRQSDFLRYYYSRIPVGIGDCVMNKICRRFEAEFDGYLKRNSTKDLFDASILKSGAEYSKREYRDIERLYQEYRKRIQQFTVFTTYERVDEDEAATYLDELRAEFMSACDAVCPNSYSKCDIILDVCYRNSCSKKFAWDMCGEQMIENLLDNNDRTITYPELDPDGDIYFRGYRFGTKYKVMEECYGDCTE